MGNEDAPTVQMLERALEESRIDSTSDARWNLVSSLRDRAPDDVFPQAEKWCASEDWRERELGTDLLVNGWNLDPELSFPMKPEAGRLLQSLLQDPHPDVVVSAIHAAAHLDVSYELLSDRMDLAVHESTSVRHAMASSIHVQDTGKNEFRMLLALMQDEDHEVRNWAIFNLGTQSNIDGTEIREALRAGLKDSFVLARMEAVTGLARRGDAVVIPIIRDALEQGSHADDFHLMDDWLEAAAEIASPELLPSLEGLRTTFDDDLDPLNLAIRRCRGEISPDGVSFGLLQE